MVLRMSKSVIGIIALLLFLTSSQICLAQGSDGGGGGGGPDESCPLCVCQTDNTCSIITDCTSPTNCTSTTFTVPCTALYTLRSKVECTGANDKCYRCQSCVNIFNGVTYLANIHNSNCDSQDCDSETTVTLYPNITYTLYVCKGLCSGQDQCDKCLSTCTASGCVYKDVVSCP